jgi:hypothetical protein
MLDMKDTDYTLQPLLDLGGLNHVYDGGVWIKYAVSAAANSPEGPHGINYSLTLHDGQGNRIFGIDNAHSPRTLSGPAGKSARPAVADHMHKGGRLYRYEFVDAATLLADFDKGVVAALKKRGLKL